MLNIPLLLTRGQTKIIKFPCSYSKMKNPVYCGNSIIVLPDLIACPLFRDMSYAI